MRPKPRPPEMNVTPLVDVVLVLLIIFMVVIPQLEAGAAVDPPSAHNPDRVTPAQDPIELMIAVNGDFFLEKTFITMASLSPALQAAHAQAPQRALRIKADRTLPYAKIRSTFQMGQAVGFPGVGLEVTPSGQAPDSAVSPKEG